MAMNRRDFLKVSTSASGGLLLALNLPGCASVQTGYEPETGEWKPNAWLELTRDNDIIFTLDRVEMGQGTYTAEGINSLAEALKVRAYPARPPRPCAPPCIARVR